MDLRPFQRVFMAAVESPAYDTVALSGPRGLGKTTIAAHVLERCLTPGDSLHEPGREYILAAASLPQARLTYAIVRAALEGTNEYSWIDSATRLGATHRASNTKLRAISSNPKTSLGLVNNPVVVLDEPGALELAGGTALADSLFTAQGKVDSRLKLVLIGTLSPMATGPGHWWYDMVTAGTTGSTHVQLFQGNLETWDKWPTIRRANPLMAAFPDSRRKLLAERDAARKDTRLKARFLSFRLNLPSADESTMLLSVPDWLDVLARDVPERDGRPVVGVDLGQSRAWSTAVAVWPNGRTEAVALTAGLPDIAAQEKRDGTPRGVYQSLVDSHRLRVAHGLRVPPVKQLTDFIQDEWGKPAVLICDRFKLDTLRDNTKGVKIEPRVSRWSESTEDISAFRKLAMDGPLSCEATSADLLTASLSVALVENDTSGNCRMIKRGTIRRLPLPWPLVKYTGGPASRSRGVSIMGWRDSNPVNRRVWRRVRRLVLDRDGWRCRTCGKAGRLQVDHFKPLSAGGDTYALENLQALCVGCHVAKTAAENRNPNPERDAWRALVAARLT